MKLGVDGYRIHGHTGVPRYIVNIVKNWDSAGNIGPFDKIVIYTPRKIDPSQLTLKFPVEERIIPSHASQLVWQNTVLPRACDADVLWCPAYVAPIHCNAKVVVTTYDATIAIHPELYPFASRIFYRHFYGWCSRHATLLITNNNQSCLDIEKYFRVPKERIRIVPFAPAQIFRKLNDDKAVEDTCLRLIGDDRPYFLSVGKISARRNLPLVIKGFARFRERTGLPHRLIIVGSYGLSQSIKGIAGDLGLAEHLIHFDYATDEDLLHLYNGTEGFITAATYESTSLTTMEAQVCGAPVIIPDLQGMREMTSDIAVIMPRVGIEEISDAMIQLATDSNLRHRLSEEGHCFASSFSWERSAQETLSVLEEAVNMPNPKLLECK